MHETKRPSLTDLREGARAGISDGLRAAFGNVMRDPLPMRHVELLLELRRRERENAAARNG